MALSFTVTVSSNARLFSSSLLQFGETRSSGSDWLYYWVSNADGLHSIKSCGHSACQGECFSVKSICGKPHKPTQKATCTWYALRGVLLKKMFHLQILTKSASVRGFFLPDYASHSAEYLQKLIAEMARGRIQSTVDNGAQSPGGPFRGLDGIYEAIDVSAQYLVWLQHRNSSNWCVA